MNRMKHNRNRMKHNRNRMKHDRNVRKYMNMMKYREFRQ